MRSRARVYLSLGRVSNLPTVWSNVLAGTALAGASDGARTVGPLIVSMSLYYAGGMFLNDAFDRDHDALHRPERPIPAGLIAAREVFVVGFCLLFAATLLLALLSSAGAGHALGVLGGLALAGLIVLYDRFHKNNPASPLLMGACRSLVYVTTSLVVAGGVSFRVGVGALFMFAYLNALTLVAKRGLASDAGVAALVAAISLLDALMIAASGGSWLALLAGLGFPLTIAGQKYVSGT